MPLDFPTDPAVDQIYTFMGKRWKWNGVGWAFIGIGLRTFPPFFQEVDWKGHPFIGALPHPNPVFLLVEREYL